MLHSSEIFKYHIHSNSITHNVYVQLSAVITLKKPIGDCDKGIEYKTYIRLILSVLNGVKLEYNIIIWT